jgi:DNA-binding MarR family transcriptional regulator
LDTLCRLSRASRALRRQLLRCLEQFEVSDSQLLLLACCAADADSPPSGSPGTAQSELAAALSLSPAQVSGLLEQLRGRRLIEAVRPQEDRRRQVWRLTPDGWAVFDQLLATLAPWAEQLDAALPAARQRELVEMLARLEEPRPPAASNNDPKSDSGPAPHRSRSRTTGGRQAA